VSLDRSDLKNDQARLATVAYHAHRKFLGLPFGTLDISQAVGPTSSRNAVVRYRPRRTNPASSLTRCFSASIICVSTPPAAPAALAAPASLAAPAWPQ